MVFGAVGRCDDAFLLLKLFLDTPPLSHASESAIAVMASTAVHDCTVSETDSHFDQQMAQRRALFPTPLLRTE